MYRQVLVNPGATHAHPKRRGPESSGWTGPVGRDTSVPLGQLRRDILDCTEVMEQLSEYLDPDVRAELRKAVDEHLQGCKDCTFYVDTVRKTVTLYQADRKIEVPMKATARLHEALAAEYRRGAARRTVPTD